MSSHFSHQKQREREAGEGESWGERGEREKGRNLGFSQESQNLAPSLPRLALHGASHTDPVRRAAGLFPAGDSCEQ